MYKIIKGHVRTYLYSYIYVYVYTFIWKLRAQWLHLCLQILIRMMEKKWNQNKLGTVIENWEWRWRWKFTHYMPQLIMHKAKHMEFNKQQLQTTLEGSELERKPCAHIELLHTQLVVASSEIQNAQECTPNCLSHALHSVSNALLYPQSFLSLSSLHNLYTNPSKRLWCTHSQLTKFLNSSFHSLSSFLIPLQTLKLSYTQASQNTRQKT
jgi:hypothetical protein